MAKNCTTRNGKTYCYDYPNKAQMRYFIDKEIFKGFQAVCEAHNLDKSKLIEHFMKTLSLRYRDNTLSQTTGYLTINLTSAKREPKKTE
jgi:hypothetical protein